MPSIVRTFLTYSNGRPRTYGVLVDQRQGSVTFSKWDLRAFANAADRHPGACAFGKLVVLTDDGIVTFQSHPGRDPSRAFCGNSTAAGLSYLDPDRQIRTKVHGVGRRSYDIHARIEGDTVAQNWIVPPEPAQVRCWRGCRVLFLPTLNQYAIFLDPLPEGIGAGGVLRKLQASALATKLAVVAGTADAPIVEFHNSNGRHGAAPQTGVATLALASRSSPWLKARFPNGRFAYATADGPRVAVLPAVSDTACGRLSIEMPEVSVSFDPIAIEKAA